MILGINTCTQKIEICLITKNQTFYKASQHQKNDSEFILNCLAEFLKAAKKEIFDLQKIICIKGPGSFTAVRVGVIIANTLKSQTKAELLEIDTLNYLNYFCKESENLILSAGGKEFYILENQEVVLVNYKDIINKHFVGEISEKQLRLVLNFNFQKLNYDLEKFLEAFMNQKLHLNRVNSIEPNYIKDANVDLSGFNKSHFELENLQKSEPKKGYFMVLMSFLICFLMTPLIVTLYESEVSTIQTYAAKKEFMDQKLIRKNLTTQIFDNPAWHGRNFSESLTLDNSFKQQIINQTVQTLPHQGILSDPTNCENFDFLMEECDSELANFGYTVPLINHGSLSTECEKFNLNFDEDSIDSNCAFNLLNLAESNYIPLFTNPINPQANNPEIQIRFKLNAELSDNYRLVNIDTQDNSPVVLELSLIQKNEQEDQIYFPNFSLNNNLQNKEITASKLKTLNLFNNITLDQEWFKLNLLNLDFRNVKDISQRFNWDDLENVYLKVNFPNSAFKANDDSLINRLEYQLVSNFKIGLEKSIILNTIEKNNLKYYDSYVYIPVKFDERLGIVIDN